MRSLLRIFSFGLICSLLVVFSDTAVKGSLGDSKFGASFGASMADHQAPVAWATLRQHLPTASRTEVLNGSSVSGVTLTDPRNETHSSAASGGTRKEYGRSGRPIVTAQGVGDVSVSPDAYQTPDSTQGVGAFTFAVNSPSNTGHAESAAAVGESLNFLGLILGPKFSRASSQGQDGVTEAQFAAALEAQKQADP